MRKVYVSSTAFSRRDLDSIFADCKKNGIKNLEIGSNVLYDEQAHEKIVRESGDINILLHNYVPAPKVPFVLNLASNCKDILKKSRNLAQIALQISGEIGASIYSVHAGFAYHALPCYLGTKQTHLEHFPIVDARKIFIESSILLSEVAKQNGVRLLIENNVLPSFNLINGKNESYLLTSIEESLTLLEVLNKYDIGMLMDVGHLNVSAATLRFDKIDYLRQLRYYIYAFHLSENDALTDQNLSIFPNSWFIDFIKSFPENIPVTLEVNQCLEDVLNSKDFLIS